MIIIQQQRDESQNT